jgi:hypothetical protein
MVLWDKARTAAGVPGSLFFDLRRTAARNSAEPESPRANYEDWRLEDPLSKNRIQHCRTLDRQVRVQRRSGTRSVFERYVIVSHTDIEDVLEKLERKKAFETKGIYGSKRKREW